MLKTAVDDGAQDFRLQKKIPETGAVNGDVRSLHLLLGGTVRCSSLANDLSLES